MGGVAIEAAGAGVFGSDKDKIGWVGDFFVGSVNSDGFIF